MDRITILTPVHISTGIDIEMPSYHEINDTMVARYDFMDILSQLPPNVLTDSRILNELSSKQSSKKTLYRYIHQYVNYSKLTPLYYLDYTYKDLRKAKTDVSEQVHDLHKPYIPGSTIKGTLLNAWKYFLLKCNYQKHVKSNIKLIFDQDSKKSIEFHELMFGKQLEKEYQDFYKDLYGCLQCQDLYFDKLELFQATRVGAKNGKQIPLDYMECISPFETVESELFTINQFKLNLLENKYSKCNQYRSLEFLIHSFTRKTILKACNSFMKDILEVDMQNKYYYFYEDFEGINESLKVIRQELDKPNTVILRVGNSTNYFAKTVSYLIKKNDPELFEKKFYDRFAPINFGKTKPNAKIMPRTRVVYKNGKQNYLPGFIKVEYDSES